MSALAVVMPGGNVSDAGGCRSTTKPTNIAQPRHIRPAECTRTAAQIWAALCDYRNSSNEAWPTNGRIAEDCRISERTVQRGLAELNAKGWVGMPRGRSGGKHQGTLYHLHPNGSLCGRCLEAQRVTACRSLRVTKTTWTGDNGDIAYKEEPPKETTQREKPPISPSSSAPKTVPTGRDFSLRYASTTGVPVSEADHRKTEREWPKLSFAEQLAAWNSLDSLLDGRPPNKYKLPQNYVAEKTWSRKALELKKPEPRGLSADEIE